MMGPWSHPDLATASCALLACLVVVPPTMAAEPQGDTARFEDLYQRSSEAYENGRYEQAISLLRQAYAIRPEPTLLFNIGLAQEEAGDYHGAIDTYRRYLLDAKDSVGRGDARQRIAAVAKMTGDGLLTISVDAIGAAVRIDGGAPRPAPVTDTLLSAGPHEIQASAPGRREVRETVTIIAGERGEASLELPAAETVILLPEPVEPPPLVASSNPYGVWGGVAAATGGALAVSGAVLLVMAEDNRSIFDGARTSGDPVRTLTRRAALELDATIRLESGLGIGLVSAGGAAFIAGITLLVLPSDSDPTGGSTYIAPDPNGGLLVGGRF